MAEEPAGKIFINYRRGDDPGTAGRLYDRLEPEFGKDNLFMDVDTIPAGADFVTVLEGWVTKCDVLLAVIGKNWLNFPDTGGGRRLDNPNDYVRFEIDAALRLGKRVIPVLVNGAQMPTAAQLPEPLKPLARRNAVRLTHERFKADVQGLVNSIKKFLAEAAAERAVHTEAERQAAEEARMKREKETAQQLERERHAETEAWPLGKHATEAKTRIEQLRGGADNTQRSSSIEYASTITVIIARYVTKIIKTITITNIISVAENVELVCSVIFGANLFSAIIAYNLFSTRNEYVEVTMFMIALISGILFALSSAIKFIAEILNKFI